MTNTDIVIASEMKNTTAPVMITAATPRPTGSRAASTEPKTARSTIRISGKPVDSAFARSSCWSSCMPAHSACWPTTKGCTPSVTSPTTRALRRSTAALRTSSRVPVTASGKTITPSLGWACLAASAASGASST